MKPYICQIAFSVSSLPRSIEFYRNVFDLEDSGGIGFCGRDADYVQGIKGIVSNAHWLQDGRRKFQLEFFEFSYPPIYPIPAERKPCDIGLTRVVFEVADMGEALEAARRHGAKSIAGPLTIDGRGHVVMKDPDGIVAELIEAPKGLPNGRKSRIAGVAMSVSDLERTVKQYTDGFSQKLSQDKHANIDSLLGLEGAKRKVVVVDGENVWLELSQYSSPRPHPRRNGHLLTDIGISHIGFGAETVSDFKTMFNKVTEEKWLKPHNPKPHYVGKLAAVMYGRDNEGFTIETLFLASFVHGLFGLRPPKAFDHLGQKFFEMVWKRQYKSQKYDSAPKELEDQMKGPKRENNSKNQNNKPVALITGAARGIGLLAARRLSTTHRVVLLDIQADQLPQAAASCSPDAISVVCDITKRDQVDAAVAEIVRQTGRIDVIVSSAAIGVGGSLRLIDPDAISAQLDVNVTGNWRIIWACLPHIIERRGYILGVSSAAAFAPTPVLGPYCASKAGLEMLLDVLSIELAPLGVDVGVAYFTFVKGEMVESADKYIPAFKYMHENQLWPINKLISNESAADAIVKAVHGRKRRAFSPGWIRWLSRFRMLLRTRLACRDNIKLMPKLDELTTETVKQRGTFASSMASSTPNRAIAESYGHALMEL
ncbi:MAG: SDR family NAD(P)-dependent oxidoreductase [Syntrophobacteraceae bacterium]